MPRNRTLVAALLCCTTLMVCADTAAQSYASSPRGLLSTEGDVESYLFGAYPDARHMLFDGELRNSALLLREVALRDDFRPNTTTSSMGRRWSDVKLSIGECDMNSVFPTFSQNSITPTRVFSGTVAWPTNTGVPTTLPTNWTKKFPFSTTWPYSGSRDICLDFDFNGGVLANNAAWATNKIYNYYLDAFPSATANVAPQTHYGKALRQGCIDSGGAQGATNFLNCTAYGDNHHDPKLRGKYRLYTFSYFTAQGRPVANVVNFVGIPGGFPFSGITCNLLYLDIRRFLLVNVSLAAPRPGAWSGYVYPSWTPDGIVPINPAWTGLEMWAQAMFDDSKTTGTKLSRATMIRIPQKPRVVHRSALVQTHAKNKRSFGYGPYTAPKHNPILRYTK
jgi:hypothetical protein